MSDGDSKPAIDADTLLSVARELTDAAAEMRAIRSNSSVTINAGGLSAGLAIGVSLVALALVFLGGVWFMLNLAGAREELARTRQDLQDQQAAWVSVMQQRISEAKQ